MKIINFSSNLNILKHPIATIDFLRGNKNNLHKEIILDSAKYLWGDTFDKNEWSSYIQEIENKTLLPANIIKNNSVVVGNNLNTTFGKWIYCCIRFLKPNTLIETGVAHGYSSWIILNALHKNNKGKLYSIDLPNQDTNSNYNFTETPKTGWLVPDALRSRWEMHLGDAKILLPEILSQLKEIDIFFHDSDHSYEHMKYEFETSHPFIKKGGILLSDDVDKNESFSEHANTNHLKSIRFNKGGTSIL